MPDTLTKPPRVVALDSDRLGHIAGALFALAVALAQMFWRDADLLTTIVRSAWTYVGAYAGTFILVRLFLRASLFQMINEKRLRREERRRMMKERREAAEAGGVAIVPPLEELDEQPSVLEQSGLPPL